MAFPSNRYGNPFGFSLTPWVKRLLIVNVAIALVGWIVGWFFPGDLVRAWLAFRPADVLLRPWTPLTYMFVHGGLWHLLLNMLGLFFFGPPLEERWGSTGFIRFYLIAGLGGAVLSALVPGTIVLGASGAVLGLLLAYAMAWPDNPIYIYGILPVKAKWLVAGIVVLNLVSALANRASGVAYLAHLGGLAAAFLYLKSPWAPNPYGGLAAARPRRTVWQTLQRRRKPAVTGVRHASASSATNSVVSERTAARAEERELLEEVDRILEKISKSGMDSLTPPERKRLDEVSRRYRSN